MLVLAPLAMFLSCCAPAPSNIACPNLPVYSPEVQTKAADELDAMPEDSVIANVFMPDYGSMRAAVRACLKERHSP